MSFYQSWESLVEEYGLSLGVTIGESMSLTFDSTLKTVIEESDSMSVVHSGGCAPMFKGYSPKPPTKSL